MILKDITVDKELYLTPKRELIKTEKEETFEILFAEEYRKAKEEGIVEGERRGYERAQEELHSLEKLLQRLSEKLLEQKQQLLQQMKPEMSGLVLAVAEKVIRQQLQASEILNEQIQSLLDLAINAFPDEKLKVFVAPQDLEKLQIEGISFFADTTLCSGDCRIEARSGIVNAAIRRLLDDMAC